MGLAGSAISTLKNFCGAAAGVTAGLVTSGDIGALTAVTVAAGFITTQSWLEERGADRVDERLKLVEDWLTQLVRQHGDLTKVVEAISHGDANREGVSSEAVHALREVLTARSDQTEELIRRHETLLIRGFANLERLLDARGETLDGITNQLSELKAAHDKHAVVSAEAHSITHASLADIKAYLEEKLGNKSLGQDGPLPELSDEDRAIIKEAKRLGDAETKAQAAILDRDFVNARQNLDEAMTPALDKAFDLLTLEGDYFYYQGLFDDAIEPYERAHALRPNDFTAISNLALAHQESRQGSTANHIQTAIDLHITNLDRTKGDVFRWAMTHNNLGNAFRTLPTGDKPANTHRAIQHFNNALSIWTRESNPDEWGTVQNNLASAWGTLPTGNRAENLGKSIEHCELALTVFSLQSHPAGWAMALVNLGNALSELPNCDERSISKAIHLYEQALLVRTFESRPTEWAITKANLGVAWGRLHDGNEQNNLRTAILCFEDSLRVRTRETHPAEWAMTQSNLGVAWAKLSSDGSDANILKAIECFEMALDVRTKEAYPLDWATTHNNLGNALVELNAGDRAAHISRALECFNNALSVRTKSACPIDWATTRQNLGNAMLVIPSKDREQTIEKAIECYEDALSVFSVDEFPEQHRHVSKILSVARWELKQLQSIRN